MRRGGSLTTVITHPDLRATSRIGPSPPPGDPQTRTRSPATEPGLGLHGRLPDVQPQASRRAFDAGLLRGPDEVRCEPPGARGSEPRTRSRSVGPSHSEDAKRSSSASRSQRSLLASATKVASARVPRWLRAIEPHPPLHRSKVQGLHHRQRRSRPASRRRSAPGRHRGLRRPPPEPPVRAALGDPKRREGLALLVAQPPIVAAARHRARASATPAGPLVRPLLRACAASRARSPRSGRGAARPAG